MYHALYQPVMEENNFISHPHACSEPEDAEDLLHDRIPHHLGRWKVK